MARDRRIDAYIAERTAAFAQPILHAIRKAMHKADDAIEESIKWGAPAFLWNGRTLALMASFKKHAVLNFIRDKELDFAGLGLEDKSDEAMGRLGRIESAAELPPERTIIAIARAAIALEQAGPRKKAAKKGPIKVPALPKAFEDALAANPRAKAVFSGFPPGARREYVEWIAEAKQDATRDRRIATAIEWLVEGKKRNWKYEKC